MERVYTNCKTMTIYFDSREPSQPRPIKINSDLFVAEWVQTVLGFVIRNEKGDLLCIEMKRTDAKQVVEEADAAAALFGLQMAIQMGFKGVIMESNSISLVPKLQSGKKGLAPVDFMLEDTGALRNKCDVVLAMLASHVKRGVTQLYTWLQDLAH